MSTRSRRVDPSATAPTTTTTPPPATYVVKRGDTLTAIARFFHVSMESLLSTNQLANGDQIAEGQVLQIPPAPPVQFTVTPPRTAAGPVITFDVTGAIAGEMVTFRIDRPDGTSFSGPPHTAGPDGAVSAQYRTAGDAPATYTVTATGDRGTSISATFVVDPT